jgi:hypothetical protein
VSLSTIPFAPSITLISPFNVALENDGESVVSNPKLCLKDVDPVYDMLIRLLLESVITGRLLETPANLMDMLFSEVGTLKAEDAVTIPRSE